MGKTLLLSWAAIAIVGSAISLQFPFDECIVGFILTASTMFLVLITMVAWNTRRFAAGQTNEMTSWNYMNQRATIQELQKLNQHMTDHGHKH